MMSVGKWSAGLVTVTLAAAALAAPMAADGAGAARFRFDRADYSAQERAIYLPVQIDYPTAQSAAGTTFRSVDATAMFRCTTREYALVDRRYFSGPQRTGEVVATTVEAPADVRWHAVNDAPQFARAFSKLRQRCR